MDKTATNRRAVLVTTKHRGVFFGWAEETTGEQIVLHDARMAIRFGCTKGILQLAHTGPTSESKIGAPAPRIELRDITSVSDVSETAVAAWNAA
jgi:hypothetical protein